jgi:cbb3-type cytochrome oxidase subunit 3
MVERALKRHGIIIIGIIMMIDFLLLVIWWFLGPLLLGSFHQAMSQDLLQAMVNNCEQRVTGARVKQTNL